VLTKVESRAIANAREPKQQTPSGLCASALTASRGLIKGLITPFRIGAMSFAPSAHFTSTRPGCEPAVPVLIERPGELPGDRTGGKDIVIGELGFGSKVNNGPRSARGSVSDRDRAPDSVSAPVSARRFPVAGRFAARATAATRVAVILARAACL